MKDPNPLLRKPFSFDNYVRARYTRWLNEVLHWPVKMFGASNDNAVKIGDLVFRFLPKLDHDFSFLVELRGFKRFRAAGDSNVGYPN